jgi:hypothetical protein
MTAAFSTETFIAIYQTARRYISENSDPYDEQVICTVLDALGQSSVTKSASKFSCRGKGKGCPITSQADTQGR